jgi:hypothetical protein
MARQSPKKRKATSGDHSGAEKPVSLWGASFTDVLAALLSTKPMPKDKDKEKSRREETK